MATKLIAKRTAALQRRTLKISAIVPVFNEAGLIQEFLAALAAELQQHSKHYEIIVVDDGSKDNTVNLIEPLIGGKIPLKIIKLSRNFGKEIALTSGLEACSGDVAILIDSDFQHPVAVVGKFLAAWGNGFDMVYGVRENRNNETVIKRAFSRFFYRTMQCLTRMNVVADAGDFRLLDRKVIAALNACKEKVRFMKGLYAWVGYTSTGVAFTVSERKSGKSSYNFMKLAELAVIGITSFSNVPLRVWSLVGLGISLLSFACALFVITKTIILGVDIPGYASLMVTVIFFGGIQLFSIGILGEYIARIFNEVKNRPTYIVAQRLGFEEDA
jgi:glycosyltransferase involved in cell wall biosynthesis